MVIGYPTDVKHVAHIGWDGGPSSVVNSTLLVKYLLGNLCFP